MMRALLLVSALVFSGLLNTSFAHQQKEAYITLLFNQRSGNLEVSHRFLLHDAEHGLARILANIGDLSVDKATQENFFAYVQQHFQVRSAEDVEIKLASVGYELDAKYFWVYQEVKIPDTNALMLKHSALHELWPSQTNHINIEKDGWVKSLRLQKSDDVKWQVLSLTKPAKF